MAGEDEVSTSMCCLQDEESMSRVKNHTTRIECKPFTFSWSWHAMCQTCLGSNHQFHNIKNWEKSRLVVVPAEKHKLCKTRVTTFKLAFQALWCQWPLEAFDMSRACVHVLRTHSFHCTDAIFATHRRPSQEEQIQGSWYYEWMQAYWETGSTFDNNIPVFLNSAPCKNFTFYTRQGQWTSWQHRKDRWQVWSLCYHTRILYIASIWHEWGYLINLV